MGRNAMEMHQVRYFLAVARNLNFTRAAEECNVAQPSLTRAIRQLEEELGGDLFRRERPHAQLTELGSRMQPLLQQCYDSALGARSLASSMKSGEFGALRIALSKTIDLALIMPHIHELQRHFKELDLKLVRGSVTEVVDSMKNGAAELAIASSIGEAWDRLDAWPLFSEGFALASSKDHRLAGLGPIRLSDLQGERFLMRPYCEQLGQFTSSLKSNALLFDRGHEVSDENDLAALVMQGFGIAFVPRSTSLGSSVARAPVTDFTLQRTIFLYGVAGRQRTPAANLIMKMLRGADWSRYAA
jgi:DNA-binding transcriptional LysR family regulator